MSLNDLAKLKSTCFVIPDAQSSTMRSLTGVINKLNTAVSLLDTRIKRLKIPGEIKIKSS